MKTRNCFVSNSSTTSFCIFGTTVSQDEYEGNLYNRAREIGLYTNSPPYSDETYVGRELSAMKDEETLKQFKDRTIVDICTLLGKSDSELSFSICEHAYYDG